MAETALPLEGGQGSPSKLRVYGTRGYPAAPPDFTSLATGALSLGSLVAPHCKLSVAAVVESRGKQHRSFDKKVKNLTLCAL